MYKSKQASFHDANRDVRITVAKGKEIMYIYSVHSLCKAISRQDRIWHATKVMHTYITPSPHLFLMWCTSIKTLFRRDVGMAVPHNNEKHDTTACTDDHG